MPLKERILLQPLKKICEIIFPSTSDSKDAKNNSFIQYLPETSLGGNIHAIQGQDFWLDLREYFTRLLNSLQRISYLRA